MTHQNLSHIALNDSEYATLLTALRHWNALEDRPAQLEARPGYSAVNLLTKIELVALVSRLERDFIPW